MNKIKRKYQSPQLTLVRLDREISLALNSLPPLGPDETVNNQTPDFFNSCEPVKA
jgi:hypothetical protein